MKCRPKPAQGRTENPSTQDCPEIQKQERVKSHQCLRVLPSNALWQYKPAGLYRGFRNLSALRISSGISDAQPTLRAYFMN